MGSFEETTKVIFNLLDFDKDGIIKKEDVKIILSYLPLNDVSEEKDKKLESVKEILGVQMKSWEEIDDIVSKTFKKYEDRMNFEQFEDTVQNKKSDVLLQIICFLYMQKPFSAKI
jgi:Ca2+-binding EF-hand superfamily protein